LAVLDTLWTLFKTKVASYNPDVYWVFTKIGRFGHFFSYFRAIKKLKNLYKVKIKVSNGHKKRKEIK